MSSPCQVRISSDFSEYPAGRHIKDGPYSGEALRDQIIAPKLNACEKLTIILDGVEFAYSPSFLEEAFGGLVRHRIATKEELLKKLIIISDDDPSYKEEVIEYINNGIPGKT